MLQNNYLIVDCGLTIVFRFFQDSLTLGTWVALHRARKVRKLLLKSRDAPKQHFLVSAQYAGEFSRSVSS